MLRGVALKPPWPDKAENADDDEVERDDIIEKGRAKENQDAGQDGDDGLQGDVIHEGYPQVGRIHNAKRNRAEKTQPTFLFHQ